MKTEEPEVAAPNTAVSAAGLGATLETVLAVVGELDVSGVTGPALAVAAAVTAVCSGTEREEAGDAGSVLMSGTPVAAGVASAEGARKLVLGAMAPGLLLAGWAGTGCFLTVSEVCRGAGGSGADCCGPRSEAVDAETSLLPGFSGKDDDVASSVLLAEDTGRVGADAELRRPPNDMVGKDVGREVAVVADGGADEGTGLLVCWLPNEKLDLLPLRDIPPKLRTPEDPALVRGRLLKTLVGAPLVLVLAAGGTVVAVTEEGTGGSAGFPNTGGPAKLNPEGTRDVLVGCALVRLVDEVLLAGFAESSAWPTRSPEKLPRVSPAKELGNRSSPNLDGGVSSFPGGVERAIPEGATGLTLDGADSPGGAVAVPVVADAVVIAEGEELSGMVSDKGLPPPPNENVSGWFDSLAGGVAPCVAVKLEDGVGVITPKLKPVPDGENEKGLLNCPTADGVQVAVVSTLAVPGPEALSLDDS